MDTRNVAQLAMSFVSEVWEVENFPKYIEPALMGRCYVFGSRSLGFEVLGRLKNVSKIDLKIKKINGYTLYALPVALPCAPGLSQSSLACLVVFIASSTHYGPLFCVAALSLAVLCWWHFGAVLPSLMSHRVCWRGLTGESKHERQKDMAKMAMLFVHRITHRIDNPDTKNTAELAMFFVSG